VVKRTSKRILRFLQRRGVITLQTAPGNGEVTVVGDETMGGRAGRSWRRARRSRVWQGRGGIWDRHGERPLGSGHQV